MKTTNRRCGRSLLCGAALLTLFHASPARAQIQVHVNDRQVRFGNVAPAHINGRVFIPLRAVVEALGAEVRWSASSQTVHGSKGNREFSLPIGSNTAQVNGRSLPLDAPARLIAGNTMVPLRFVAEALGANVDWNASENRVAIHLGDGGGGPVDTGDSVSGELISVQSDANPATITVRVAGLRQTYRMDGGTRVMRGAQGSRAQRINPDQLRAGDQVTIRLDSAGRMAEQIDATGSAAPPAQNDRTVTGEVIRVVRSANPPLLVVMVNGARQTYDAGSSTITHRTGRRQPGVAGTLQDVVVGDTVVVTLDRTGQIAERIEATHVRAQ